MNKKLFVGQPKTDLAFLTRIKNNMTRDFFDPLQDPTNSPILARQVLKIYYLQVHKRLKSNDVGLIKMERSLG